MSSLSTIRLATASPATQASTPATLKQLASIARRAASNRADILLLPEAYLGGYPRGSAFGCVIGDRSAAGRDEYVRYFDAAVDLGDTVGDGAGAGARWVNKQLPRDADADPADELSEGPKPRGDGTREELERIAAETGVFLVTGLIEKAGGSLYCAAVYVCPKKGIIGKRRKVMPTGTERLIWAQGSPATLRAVSTTIRGVRINLAAAICWESYMPLLRQALYAQNINLYLAPTADGRDAWLGLMRTIGVEGRCFVVSSNMAARSSQPQEDSSAIHVDGSTASSSPVRQQTAGRRPRRKSVFDEDGNEIVLCCPADDDDGKDTSPKLVNGTASKSASSWVSRGGSSIVSPFGDVLAGPQWENDEDVVYADVDFRDCIRGRLDLDNGGSYSRNDAFKFSVEGLDLDPLPYQ
ncbi:nitrilase [Stachybotrys elegans]|uniref:Nitrilase n=1 Tax=Stachybotrys elegans TaxID=80388 RepID=A0A8K0SSD3_9HYPO|nr:nitrilase [Stachybotrys elegans]